MPDYSAFMAVAQDETERAVLLPGDSIALLLTALGEHTEWSHVWRGSGEFDELTTSELNTVEALVAKTERALMEELTMVSGVPLGGIIPYAGAVVPENFVWCDGSNLSQDEYPELALVVEDIFKDTINGVQIIRVPYLNAGRFIMGRQDGTWETGDTGGAATHTLTVDEIPAHSHGINRSLVAASGTTRRAVEGSTSDVDTLSEGGGQAHNNLPPYFVLPYIMRVL